MALRYQPEALAVGEIVIHGLCACAEQDDAVGWEEHNEHVPELE
jgi:hypothetical protein